jgi:hypothetical protein
MQTVAPKYKNKITVISPSVRMEGLKLVQKALEQQQFEEFDWIVCSPENPHTWATWVPNPPKKEGDYWTIYKAYNAMIREADGELIVSMQDYTYTKPDTLERLWFHYQNDPKSIIGAVGNKYQNDKWLVKTWSDPRINGDLGSFSSCDFNAIELNLCSFPKEALCAIGGFDEFLDRYSSLCGYGELERLSDLGGYSFKLDHSINTFSLEHGRLPKWEENEPFSGQYEERKQYLKNVGKWPVLDYL